MSQLSKSALDTQIDASIFTNGNRYISADIANTLLKDMSDSMVNKITDANAVQGYLQIDADGRVDVTFITAATPTGKFLRDDGTWAAGGGGGGSQTLANTLAIDNKTGGLYIVSDNGYSKLLVGDANFNLEFDNGVNTVQFFMDATATSMVNSTLINIDSPIVSFLQNQLLIPNASFFSNATEQVALYWDTNYIALKGTGVSFNGYESISISPETVSISSGIASSIFMDNTTANWYHDISITLNAPAVIIESTTAAGVLINGYQFWDIPSISASMTLNATGYSMVFDGSEFRAFPLYTQMSYTDGGATNTNVHSGSTKAEIVWGNGTVLTKGLFQAASMTLYWSDSVVTAQIVASNLTMALSHTSEIEINTPDVYFPQLTDFSVPYLDGDKILRSSAVVYSELLNLSGSTSNLQAQIDALVSGLSWKQAVKCATTANITLSGPQTIDGVSVTTGDRVLVKDQTTATENGIYIVKPGAWTRSTDADTGAELVSSTVAVSGGTISQDKQYVCTNDTVTIGATNIVFVLVGGTTYVGTTGRITVTGNVIDVGADVALLTSPIFITDITTPKIKDVTEFVNSAGEFKFSKATAGRSLIWTNGQDLSFSAIVGGSPSITIDKTTGKVKFENETASTPLKLDINKGLTSGAFGLASGEFAEGIALASTNTEVATKVTRGQVKQLNRNF